MTTWTDVECRETVEYIGSMGWDPVKIERVLFDNGTWSPWIVYAWNGHEYNPVCETGAIRTARAAIFASLDDAKRFAEKRLSLS